MARMSILIFPANSTDSVLYAQELRQTGIPFCGASLDPEDPFIQDAFERVRFLPHLTAPDFWPALEALIETEGIQELVTPLRVVYEQCRRRLSTQMRLRCVPTQQVETLLTFVQQQTQAWWASGLLETWPLPWQTALPEPQALQAMLFQALRIPGQSQSAKLLTLTGVLASAPRGDVVEVGVFWGRSLCMLGLLARHCQCGSILGIDFWPAEGYVQGQAELDQSSALHHLDQAYQGACLALWPLLRGQLSLWRCDSQTAAARYAQREIPVHPLFGAFQSSGEIAVLHLDGNHAAAAVAADLEAWWPLLASEAWLILDDYCWHFGQGPQEQADRWLEAHRSEIQVAFVLAETLFVYLKKENPKGV